uniref:Uncharacterized protein n=1 Tax=Chromera velia CCMP2878 TaxID=1169474 RepID=A0A0G4HLG1_9ALVE|eukprot:Cvel_7345.t1-p1 / transcript=Cvel_7345.t1 / gene=Cvel_7345 / organism=Chromera_velia_CCMP2878 / gene_product=hypothetical protein / transcript_product=hypothetical protein / location=Cvel_scaffold381:11819-15822(-) / protein_length=837 / sequence_SO=supercontig / SO=protein_coding / is_pseudo=false
MRLGKETERDKSVCEGDIAEKGDGGDGDALLWTVLEDAAEGEGQREKGKREGVQLGLDMLEEANRVAKTAEEANGDVRSERSKTQNMTEKEKEKEKRVSGEKGDSFSVVEKGQETKNYSQSPPSLPSDVAALLGFDESGKFLPPSPPSSQSMRASGKTEKGKLDSEKNRLTLESFDVQEEKRQGDNPLVDATETAAYVSAQPENIPNRSVEEGAKAAPQRETQGPNPLLEGGAMRPMNVSFSLHREEKEEEEEPYWRRPIVNTFRMPASVYRRLDGSDDEHEDDDGQEKPSSSASSSSCTSSELNEEEYEQMVASLEAEDEKEGDRGEIGQGRGRGKRMETLPIVPEEEDEDEEPDEGSEPFFDDFFEVEGEAEAEEGKSDVSDEEQEAKDDLNERKEEGRKRRDSQTCSQDSNLPASPCFASSPSSLSSSPSSLCLTDEERVKVKRTVGGWKASSFPTRNRRSADRSCHPHKSDAASAPSPTDQSSSSSSCDPPSSSHQPLSTWYQSTPLCPSTKGKRKSHAIPRKSIEKRETEKGRMNRTVKLSTEKEAAAVKQREPRTQATTRTKGAKNSTLSPLTQQDPLSLEITGLTVPSRPTKTKIQAAPPPVSLPVDAPPLAPGPLQARAARLRVTSGSPTEGSPLPPVKAPPSLRSQERDRGKKGGRREAGGPDVKSHSALSQPSQASGQRGGSVSLQGESSGLNVKNEEEEFSRGRVGYCGGGGGYLSHSFSSAVSPSSKLHTRTATLGGLQSSVSGRFKRGEQNREIEGEEEERGEFHIPSDEKREEDGGGLCLAENSLKEREGDGRGGSATASTAVSLSASSTRPESQKSGKGEQN